ncbi:leucine-rich repeat domain-containing protein [Prevotella multiformis]|uniref:leucine-rich repeat domain-containing protein n=1 Tax=Prevotella multiformis TaxID=282402 RepID=UPI001BA43C22|nr:leucine-rich repeat domain-containing protein [Prevotella multiformis]QUB72198.1 leucine-rich repeat domain-containing protein [Prevotella multiformis]
MKIFTSKKVLTVIALACACFTVHAQESLTVTTAAGKLAEHIPAARKYQITDLKVSGEINGTDILLLRQMAGKGLKEDDQTEGRLTSLDLSEVRIVEDGENYCAIKQGLSTKYYKPVEEDVIPPYMFYKLARLTKIQLPASAKKIDKSALTGCTALAECAIPEAVTVIGDYAFAQCEKLASAVFPSALEEIGAHAFEGCSALSTLSEFPRTLTDIGENAFYKTAVTAFSVSEESDDYAAVEGVLYNKDRTSLVAYPTGSTATTIQFPDEIADIEANACAYAGNLKTLVLPEGLTNIGEGAFAYAGLTHITSLASGLSVKEQAFAGCADLVSVNFKGAVSGIEKKAFFGAKKLAVVHFAGTGIPEFGESVFTAFRTQLSIYVPAEMIAKIKETITKKKVVLGSRYDVLDITTSDIKTADQLYNVSESARYDLNGNRLSAPAKGVNVIRLSNGKTIKAIER